MRPYADQPVADVLHALAQRTPAPGGGAAAALTVALSAGLAGMAARYSVGILDDAMQLADRSDDCRTAAVQLADDDRLAYTQVLNAGDAVSRSVALRGAAEVALAIAEVGAETAHAAARLAAEGKPSVRGDAGTGVILAVAATRAAVDLVRMDAAADDADLLERARRALEQVDGGRQGSG